MKQLNLIDEKPSKEVLEKQYRRAVDMHRTRIELMNASAEILYSMRMKMFTVLGDDETLTIIEKVSKEVVNNKK